MKAYTVSAHAGTEGRLVGFFSTVELELLAVALWKQSSSLKTNIWFHVYSVDVCDLAGIWHDLQRLYMLIEVFC